MQKNVRVLISRIPDFLGQITQIAPLPDLEGIA